MIQELLSKCSFRDSLTTPLYNPRESTINPCFISSVNLILYSAITLFVIYQLFTLLFNNHHGPYRIKYSFGNPFKLHSVGIFQLIKLNSLFIQAILVLALTSFNLNNYSLIRSTLFLEIFSLVLIIPFHVIEPLNSPISSASLLIYWSTKILFNGVVLVQDLFFKQRLYIFGDLNASLIQVIEISLFINSFIIFVFELALYKPSNELIDYFEINNWNFKSVHNFFSELVFFWIEATIKNVNKKGTISLDEVEPAPIEISNEVCYKQFIDLWDPAVKKAKAKHEAKLKNIPNPTDEEKLFPKISLFFILMRISWARMIAAFTFDISEMVGSIIQAFLLQKFIEYFTLLQNPETAQPKIVGFAISTGIFVTALVRFTSFNQYFVNVFLVRFTTQSQLMSVLYRKALKLSPSARKEKTSGEIINNLSSDVFEVSSVPEALVDLIIVPIRLIMALSALIKIIGYSTWAGIISAVILVPILTVITTSVHKLYEKNMEVKDSRVKLTSEILNSIKSIKLFAWESPLLKRLSTIRKDKELELRKKIGIFNAFSLFFWKCIPFVISSSCLIAFNYFGSVPIVPSIAFPALSLFAILTDPLMMLPYLFSGLVQCNVALKRLRELLTMDELEESIVQRSEVPALKGDVTIKLKNSTFLWDTNEKDTDKDQPSNIALKNIDFTARKGQLTCIVGRVGSGKSTLIKSFLGLLALEKNNDTEAIVNGSIAYCPQDPWIMNATVKENILFGCKLNKPFYLKTIEACQLTKDFEVLPDGDRTVVGEKGISLSGGQKARVALARAVYARSDIIFLDDVLSAVDAHVGKKIINNVLAPGGLLSTKTIVLATNAVPVLQFASEIVMLKEGEIVERGSFDEVVQRGSFLAKLIEEYGKKVESEEKVEISTSESPSPLSPPESLVEEEVVEFSPHIPSETELVLKKFDTNDTHKASLASFLYDYENDEEDIVKKTGLLEEKGAQGSVKWGVYLEYFKACNYSYLSIFLVCEIGTVLAALLTNYILKSWSEKNLESGKNIDPFFYLALYCVSGIAAALLALIGTVIIWTFCSIKGSIYFHDKMTNSVTRSPMSFFETTPIGRILNRFSEDMNVIDGEIMWSLLGVVTYAIEAVGYLVVIVVSLPFMFFVIVALFFVYNLVRQYYISASRELKRLNSAQKSPIFANLQESISGIDTILSYNQESRFIHKNTDFIDKLMKVSYSNTVCNRWLSMRLQTISVLIIYTTTLFIWLAGGTKRQLTPGLVGFVMVNALGVTGTLNAIIRYYANVEVQSVAVERVIEYCNLPPEADTYVPNKKPASDWPKDGRIEFKNYTTKYRETLDPVLKNINLEIKQGDKIGIVGRTGAGKSTLSVSLFRLIEATEGFISIDGVNTSEIGLYDLRKNLNIIPQDSNSVEGSVRENLDPLEQYSDEKLWKVLELSHLKEHVLSMKTKKNKDDKEDKKGDDEAEIDPSKYDIGLSAKIFEGGSNLSSGQRQLMSLARSLLNPSKVLILDEATAAVDVETDKIIQKTIRSEFKDKTILTIAHRLDTVLDSDKILVLDKGEVKEYDTPKNLLSDKNSEFYSLCSEGGHLQNIKIEDLK